MDALNYSLEETKRLDEIGRRAVERDLIDTFVTVCANGRVSMYLRGFLLDAHGAVMAIVSTGSGNPFCRLVHSSRILELDPSAANHEDEYNDAQDPYRKVHEILDRGFRCLGCTSGSRSDGRGP